MDSTTSSGSKFSVEKQESLVKLGILSIAAVLCKYYLTPGFKQMHNNHIFLFSILYSPILCLEI